uniref:Uncharacterized protein n=1 Tax=Alexandrium monilatum TaxID=311494 RepID=A0A7S4QGK6_9DINO
MTPLQLPSRPRIPSSVPELPGSSIWATGFGRLSSGRYELLEPARRRREEKFRKIRKDAAQLAAQGTSLKLRRPRRGECPQGPSAEDDPRYSALALLSTLGETEGEGPGATGAPGDSADDLDDEGEEEEEEEEEAEIEASREVTGVAVDDEQDPGKEDGASASEKIGERSVGD